MLVAFILAAGLPDLVSTHWFSPDPKTLDLLKGTPINCLLVDKPQWSKPFVADAIRRGIEVMGVLRPGDAEEAVATGFSGVVLEGQFDHATADRIRSYLKDSGGTVIELGSGPRKTPLSSLTPELSATWRLSPENGASGCGDRLASEG
jgi:hypothetical protein